MHRGLDPNYNLRLDQFPARGFDRRFGARGGAELAARIVGVKIDRALGQPRGYLR